MNKRIVFFFILALSLVVFRSAHAAVIMENSLTGSSSTSSGASYSFPMGVFTGSTSATTTYLSVQFLGSSGNNHVSYTIQAVGTSTNTQIGGGNCYDSGGNTIQGYQCFMGQFAVGSTSILEFSNSANVAPVNGVSYDLVVGFSGGDTITLGTGGGDISYKWCDDLVSCENFTPMNPAVLTFVIPADGSLVNDFSDWQVAIPDGSPSGTLKVIYDPVGAGFSGSDTIQYSPYAGIGTTLSFPKLGALFTSLSITNPSYNATATLSYGTGTLWAVGHSFFTVDSPIPTSTDLTIGSSTTCTATSTGGTWGDIYAGTSNAICQTFVFLFVPSNSQQADLQHRGASAVKALESVPPFNYIAGVGTVLGSSTVGTTTYQVRTSGNSALDSIFGTSRTAFTILIWFTLGIGAIIAIKLL